MLRNPDGGGGVRFFGKKVRFNVIFALRGGGGPISRKKRYVTLEWPLICALD